MKKVLFSLILLLTTNLLFAQENNYAIINFIGRGGFKNVYINDQLVFTLGNNDIVRYKMYSKGRIIIKATYSSFISNGVIEIKANKEYYFLIGKPEYIKGFEYKNMPINKETFEIFKASFEKSKKNTNNIIEVEEDRENPVAKSPPTDYEGEKLGTCFLISKQGYFLTNYHVISGAKNVNIKGIGNDFSMLNEVDVVAFDIDLDLALLKLKNQNITFQDVPYSLNTEASASQGTKVFVLGYPLTTTMGEEIKVSAGIISSESGYKGTISQYQFSAAIQPGNSGSPLFNDNGDIIGVVDAKLEGAEAAGYAIKSQYVNMFLKLIKNIQIEKNTTTLSNLPLTELVERLKGNIFIVKCE